MQIRISRWVIVLFSVFATWSALALLGLLCQNPFRVATEMATAAGGWSSEQVRFEQGSYLFLFVCSRASARVAVTTDAGEMPAEIKLLHVPFAGWSVQSFEIGDLIPQQAEGRWRGRVELTLLPTSVGSQAARPWFSLLGSPQLGRGVKRDQRTTSELSSTIFWPSIIVFLQAAKDRRPCAY